MEEYYSKHSEEFINNTKDCNMSDLYHLFEKHLKSNAKTILDIGFGSGRDSLYFSKKFDVTSIDPTLEFCEYGKSIGLKKILCLKVENMVFNNEFDGIWACASLLHVKSNTLNYVFKKCYQALRKDGVIYCSFKYGDFEGVRGERQYIDLNENNFKEYICNTGFKIVETKITNDVRNAREEKWLNVVMRK